jgi:hypothetical protein
MALIVSAYFKIPSKASHDFYLEHLQRFFTGIKSHIEFFTTPDLVELLTKMRGNLPITFHIMNSINELNAFKYFGYDFWRKQCYIDVEKYHTPEVAAIWYEKKEFIEKIINIYRRIDINFNKPIIWCDAGCVRDDKWYNIISTFGQNIDVIPKNKLLMQLLNTIPKDQEYFKYPDTYIAASIIAGYPNTWNKCSELYDNSLIEYNKYNICCNSDQYVWASTINSNPKMFELVHVKECINKWFYFLDYLSLR